MSEARLWTRIRDKIGYSGHFVRLEFNPDSGIPDVEYCIKGTEGKIELKYTDKKPARANTPVFHDGGLRDSQIGWIYTRVKHGGRVWILPQIGERLFLVPGVSCRTFNEFTYHDIEKNAWWSNEGRNITADEWLDLIHILESK